jgi:predicted RecB family endonuclease
VNAEIKILDKSALIKSREMKLPLKTGEGGVLPEEERSQGRLLLEDKTIKVSGVTLSADKNDKRIRNLEVPVKATVGAVTGAMLLLSPGSGMGMLKII